ncbi:MAG: serine/threonine protein kinase [Deltaproteobacteria bacterium]|nr:MAG: serine/threonine protein kinase [Deltaproteobacteria bacterium]
MSRSTIITDEHCPRCGANLEELRQLSKPPTFCLQCRFPIVLIANKYKLVRVLGEGGFGTVFLARHIRLKRNAERVVKLIKREVFEKEGMEDRFYREVQVTSDLSQRNEHIVRIYDDFGEVPQLGHFYVMEYLQGSPLTEYVLQGKTQPIAWTLDIFRQLCDAIQAAHEEGIIHRDLKPDNILLIERRKNPHFVKVLDFGIAKPTEDSGRTELNLTQGALGTPMYMPPEQATNRPIDGRSDLYAMGIILYEMLVGRHPFIVPGQEATMSPLELLTAQMMQTPPSFKVAAPNLDIPPALEEATLKALAKKPEERFQSVEEFWQALAKAGADANITPEVATTRSERPPLPTGMRSDQQPALHVDSQDALRTTSAPASQELERLSQMSEEAVSSLPPTGDHILPKGESEADFVSAQTQAAPSSPGNTERLQKPRSSTVDLMGDAFPSSKKGLWVGLAALLVVFVGVGLYAMGFFSSKKGKAQPPQTRRKVLAKRTKPQPPPTRRNTETDAGNTPTPARQDDDNDNESDNDNDTVEPPARPTKRRLKRRRRVRRRSVRYVKPRARRRVEPVKPAKRPDVRKPTNGCPEGQIRLRIQRCPNGEGRFAVAYGNRTKRFRSSQAACIPSSTRKAHISQTGCHGCFVSIRSGQTALRLRLKDGDTDESMTLNKDYCLR